MNDTAASPKLDGAQQDGTSASTSGEAPCPLNKVAAHIETEYKVVLLDRKLSSHQDSGEPKIHPDPTYIFAWLTQTNKAAHPWQKNGTLTVTPSNVKVFVDEKCTQEFDGTLSDSDLTGGSKKKLWLRGETAGKFKVKLTLEDAGNAKILTEDKCAKADCTGCPAEKEMAVVELVAEVHQFESADFDGLTANPDLAPPAGKNYDPLTDPNDAADYHPDLLKQYHDTLKDLALPEQKLMTDAKKISGLGRILCQQSGKDNQALAKLVIKLKADEWPAGTDDYQIYINRTNFSGAVAVFDKDWEGTEKKLPVGEGLKVSELKASEKTYWIEGKTASSKPGGVRLDLTLDRPDGELPKDVKRNGDCVHFTVVKFKELKVEYKAEDKKPAHWDEDKARYFVNLTGTGAGALSEEKARTVTLGVQLTEAVAGIKVRFMLAPDKNNQTAANGGEALPAGGITKCTLPLTLEGRDVGCFEIRNNNKLYLVDGMLSIARKPNYAVTVVGTYPGGHVGKAHYRVGSSDGVDTTAGYHVKTYRHGQDKEFPTTKEKLWKWDKIDKTMKHKDKSERDKYLHVMAETDDKGYAKAEVLLSRQGGDIFQPACYIDQDSHLAKYVDGHTDLEKKKPFFAAKEIHVWRRFWVQKVKVKSIASPDFTGAISQYERVKADMIQHTDHVVPKKVVEKYSKKGIYPEYMVKAGGGTTDKLLVSDTNKTWFFNKVKAEPDKPNMIPILVCDAQWDAHPDGDTLPAASPPARMNAFPVDIDVGKRVLNPPVQGGNMLVSGNWKAQDWDDSLNGGAGDWTPERTGTLVAADLTINRNRDSLTKVSVSLPDAANANHASRIWIADLIVKAAKNYLGESFDKKILAVYDPAEPADFQNTIAHEIGHAFKQTPRGTPDNLPIHPVQADRGQGNHCQHLKEKCMMYDSGPIEGSLNRYCKICHPYLLWQDMSKIT